MEVLEVRMDTSSPLVLSTTIASAANNIEATEALPGQLLGDDVADINAFLARAMHEVGEHDVLHDRRVFTGLPLRWRFEGPHIHDSDLEPEATKARLLRWALVGRQGTPCQQPLLSQVEPLVGGPSVHRPIEDQEVLSESVTTHKPISQILMFFVRALVSSGDCRCNLCLRREFGLTSPQGHSVF